MTEQERSQTQAAASTAPGVTHPHADQLHGRLLDDFRQSLATNAEGVYERWGYTWLHSLSDSEVVAEREKFGMQPTDALDFYNQGCLQAEREEFAAAAKSFARALELKSDFPEAAFNQALALDMAGDKAKARDAWKALEKSDAFSEEEIKQIKDRIGGLADA